MRALVFIFLFIVSGITAYGQSAWQEYYNSNGIRFSVQDASCSWEGQSAPSLYKFIRIENLTANRARVSFQLEVYYGANCNGCDGASEYRSEIVLEPGAQVMGSCDYDIPARLDVLVSNPNLPALQFTQFNITNISIDWID